MLFIIDENNNVIENHGTNSAFPDGNMPNLPKLPLGQEYVRIHDDSSEAIQIMSAYEFTIDMVDDKPIITVTKTKEQHRSEVENDPINIKAKQKQAIQDQLETLDKALNRGTEDLIDLLISKEVIKEIDLPVQLKDRKALKQSLRQQLKEI